MKMLDKLSALIETKKIIAILIVTVFCIMALRGDIGSEQFMTVATVIITFYFTQSSLKNKTIE